MSDTETHTSSDVKIENSEVKTEEDIVGSFDTQPQKCVVMAAAIHVKPPTFISDTKTYEEYVRELKCWALVTNVEKAKQAIVVALAIPDEQEGSIKKKVFSEIPTEELNAENGLETLIAFLDKIFQKDSFVEAYEKYMKWNSLYRKVGQKVEDFIIDYNSQKPDPSDHLR